MAYTPTDRQAVLDALSDVVTVSPDPDNSSSARFTRHAHHPSLDPESSYSGVQPLPLSEPPPMVPAKSPFEDRSLPPPPAPEVPAKSSGTGMASKFANAFRRQTAEEKAKKRNKDKRLNDEVNKAAARTSRMDIIDRLDLSGINGSSMFHHDSPYDACTPHMNKGRRAPVRAFDPNMDPMTGLPRGANGVKPAAGRGARPTGKDADSPADENVAARPGINAVGGQSRSSTAPLVPSLPMHDGASATELPIDDDIDADRDADAERIWRSRQGYHTQPSNVPDSRFDVSNPNADVWGVSAEPWQDFAQPKARVRSTLSPYSQTAGDHSGTTSAASSVLDMEAIMTGKKKSSRPQEELAAGSASPFPEPKYDDRIHASGNSPPKRSKSLIKRIRSMRENPNVPPPDQGVEMGAVRDRRRRAAQNKPVPTTPPIPVDLQARAATPNENDVLTPRAAQNTTQDSYFEAKQQESKSANAGSNGRSSANNEGGLNRNGSLFNKLRRSQKPGSAKSADRPTATA